MWSIPPHVLLPERFYVFSPIRLYITDGPVYQNFHLYNKYIAMAESSIVWILLRFEFNVYCIVKKGVKIYFLPMWLFIVRYRCTLEAIILLVDSEYFSMSTLTGVYVGSLTRFYCLTFIYGLWISTLLRACLVLCVLIHVFIQVEIRLGGLSNCILLHCGVIIRRVSDVRRVVVLSWQRTTHLPSNSSARLFSVHPSELHIL